MKVTYENLPNIGKCPLSIPSERAKWNRMEWKSGASKAVGPTISKQLFQEDFTLLAV